MPEIDIEELREKARKATPGPWKVYGSADIKILSIYRKKYDDLISWSGFDQGRHGSWRQRERNANFIAAANPSAVLSLLDQLQAAERERDEARGKLASVAWIYNPLARALLSLLPVPGRQRPRPFLPPPPRRSPRLQHRRER